jgi:hypothetical protein
MLAYALAVGGETDEARTILADIHRRGEHEFVWPMPRFQSLLTRISPAEAIRTGPGRETPSNGKRITA